MRAKKARERENVRAKRSGQGQRARAKGKGKGKTTNRYFPRKSGVFANDSNGHVLRKSFRKFFCWLELPSSSCQSWTFQHATENGAICPSNKKSLHCIYPKLLLAGCLSPISSCSRTVCRCPSGWPTMVSRYLLILKEKGFHGKILLRWTWKTNFSKEFHIWYKFSYRCYLAISIVLFSHSVLDCWRWWWSWVNDTSGHMVATAQRHGSF